MNGQSTCRLFVAIAVPDAVRAALKQVQDELRKVITKGLVSWTRPEAMHLTLRFLGNVDSARINELQQQLQGAAAGFGGLALECQQLGCFPDPRHPRVVWAGVRDLNDRLALLAQRVDGAVSSFAEKPAEARFAGHITIARPRQLGRTEAAALSDFVQRAVERTFGAWTAGEVELIQSELSPGGSRYTTVAACEFRQKNF